MTSAVPISWFLTLSAILFALGVAGFLFRRNIITVFMSIELMLNAVNINLVAFSRLVGSAEGHAFAIFIITDAAAEAAFTGARGRAHNSFKIALGQRTVARALRQAAAMYI